MARAGRLLSLAVAAAAIYCGAQLLAFVAAPAPTLRPARLQRGEVLLRARGGGEYDVTDADIQKFYEETLSGSGGLPKKGDVVSELVVKSFYGTFSDKGFARYSGLWKGPPPGAIGMKDIQPAVDSLKEQMKLGKYTVKGGPGATEDQKVFDDGKGWIWLAADMSPGGLGLALYKAVPYGKRPLLVAKQSDVDGMFAKVNWELATKRIDITMGGPQVKQR